MSEAAVFIPLVLAAIIVVRIVADRLDRRRIQEDVAERGGELDALRAENRRLREELERLRSRT